MEGNLIMGASRALLEEVAFNRQRVTSLDWVTYPILRFADAPGGLDRDRAAHRSRLDGRG